MKFIAKLQKNFLKIPPSLLGFEPQPLGYEVGALTTTLTWQVREKGVKVCA